MPAWYGNHYMNLDEFLKPYEWNLNLPRFMSGFFGGHDRTWISGVLKAVLPAGRLTDEEISDVAYSLSFYEQHHTLDLDSARSRYKEAKQRVRAMKSIKHMD
jgi:hypothetical protein